MGQRRKGREYAVQMLYQIDQTGEAPVDVFEQFWVSQEAKPKVREFAEQLVAGVLNQRADIDRRIGGSTDRWKLDRMAVVDRNILRLAAYELVHQSDTPAAVVIDEAIEIGKRFGSDDSSKFINGILDRIRSIRDEQGSST